MRNDSSTSRPDVRPDIRRAGAILLAAALLSACADGIGREPSLWTGPVHPGTREWIEAEWDTLWTVGGPGDTLFQNPSYIRPTGTGVAVWDGHAGRVLAFDEEGDLIWTFGRLGSGPGEFERVLDFQVGTRGQLFLYDAENQRVTVLSGSGEIERMIPLAGSPHSTVMGVISDTLLALVAMSEPEAPLRFSDLEGREVARRDLPWNRFTELSSLIRQASAVSSGDRWVVAFLYGNGWFAYEGDEARDFVGGFIEHLAFPQVIEYGNRWNRTQRLLERPRCSACTLSIVDSLVVVHFGGYSEEEHRILDLHRWRDGAYRGSILLPFRAGWAVKAGDRVFTLSEEPYPTLRGLRVRTPPSGGPTGS